MNKIGQDSIIPVCLSHDRLTHWGWGKMVPILQMTFSSAIFMKENFWISNKISLEYVPWAQFHNNSTLAQVMAWHLKGNKQLPEPMMTKFTDTYMCHSTSMN